MLPNGANFNDAFVPDRALFKITTGANCDWTATLQKDSAQRIASRIFDSDNGSSPYNKSPRQILRGSGTATVFFQSLRSTTGSTLNHMLTVTSNTTSSQAIHSIAHCSGFSSSCDGANIVFLEQISDLDPTISVDHTKASEMVYFDTSSSFHDDLTAQSSASWLKVGGNPLRLNSSNFQGNPFFRWHFLVTTTVNRSNSTRVAEIVVQDGSATFRKRVIRVEQAPEDSVTDADGGSTGGDSGGSTGGGSGGSGSTTGGNLPPDAGQPRPGSYIDNPFQSDLVVFRPLSGTWHVLPRGSAADPYNHANGRDYQFGLPGDVPISRLLKNS